MSSMLPAATRRRLQALPQDQSVWEGARQTVDPNNTFAGELLQLSVEDLAADEDCDCVLWVDASQGSLRAVDLVPTTSGPESTARALIRAMEKPQAPGSTATRPQKILVRDRELQFFLRGMLRDLDIAVEFVVKLPFWDDIFEALNQTRAPILNLASQWKSALDHSAHRMWECAPWHLLEDHQILEIELNQWDLERLYVSVMGMAQMEYGLLLYRSLDSLKHFRSAIANTRNPLQLQEVFLLQDCLYLTYDQEEPEETSFLSLPQTPRWEDIEPTFGSIHPLEGMRPFLYEEESQIILAGLDAVEQFITQHRRKLKPNKFPAIQGTYLIEGLGDLPTFSVNVKTLPELSEELLNLDEEGVEDEESASSSPALQDDLVPEGAIYWYGYISWALYDAIQNKVKVHQRASTPLVRKADLSVMFLQTSRPKAKVVIDRLQAAGGISRIAIGSGEDFFGRIFDLGVVETADHQIHLFSEDEANEPQHKKGQKGWRDRCKKNQQMCAVIIAEGVTGAARGNPQEKHILAIYEVPLVPASDLQVANLKMMPMFDFPDFSF